MKRTVLVGILSSFSAVSCGDDSLERDAPPQRSAALVEELRIDGHEGELVPIGELVVTRDERIVFDQRLDAQLRFYSEEGELVGTFGRRGEGPGEFDTIESMGLSGETLWVFDLSQMRMTLVSPAIELLRTVSIAPHITAAPGDGEAPRLLRPLPRALLPDGSLLANFLVSVSDGLPEALRGVVLGRVTSDGELIEAIGRLPRVRAGVSLPGGGAGLPFPNVPRSAISRSGTRLAGAFTSLEGADVNSFRVWVWDVGGTEIWSDSYPFEPRAIPGAVADSAIDARAERLPPEFADLFRDQAEVPPTYPPLAGLHVGRDETIWVEKRIVNGERLHLALDPDGTPLGTLTLPEASRLAEAQANRIWVVETDDLGVESVVRYRVTWE